METTATPALLDLAASFARFELDTDEFYTLTAAYPAEQIATVLGIPVAVVQFERS